MNTTLAAIAYALRFANLSAEEDAMIPAPWGYDSIPQAVRIESRMVTGSGYKPHLLTTEHFADGSRFATSSAA